MGSVSILGGDCYINIHGGLSGIDAISECLRKTGSKRVPFVVSSRHDSAKWRGAKHERNSFQEMLNGLEIC